MISMLTVAAAAASPASSSSASPSHTNAGIPEAGPPRAPEPAGALGSLAPRESSEAPITRGDLEALGKRLLAHFNQPSVLNGKARLGLATNDLQAKVLFDGMKKRVIAVLPSEELLTGEEFDLSSAWASHFWAYVALPRQIPELRASACTIVGYKNDEFPHVYRFRYGRIEFHACRDEVRSVQEYEDGVRKQFEAHRDGKG